MREPPLLSRRISAGRSRPARRRAGLHRHVDLHRSFSLRLDRRGEASADLERRVGVRSHDGLCAFERGFDAGDDAFELALHADAHLEQSRQVLLERGLDLGSSSGVRRGFDLGRDDGRLALGLGIHFSVAVSLAFRAHLRRLDLAAALRLFELGAAVAAAGTFALALGLHRARGVAFALALGLAHRVRLASALALGVLAVALAVAGAVALARDFAGTLTLAGAAAGAFALRARFDVAGAFALRVTLAAQLATFTGDLGGTGFDVRVALAGAVGHGVDGGVADRGLEVDLELRARLGLGLTEDLDRRVAGRFGFLARAVFLRLQICVGRTQVFGQIAACGSNFGFHVRADLLQIRAGGQSALRLAFE